MDAAIDDGLVEFEVGDAVAEETAGSLVLLEDRYAVTHQVQLVGSSQSGRSGTDNCHLLAVALGVLYGHITLQESTLGNGAFVLAIGNGLACGMIQDTSLLAERGTDTARKLRERIGLLEQLICRFPFAMIQGIVPFGVFIAQRTSPVAEGHATIHTT